MPNSNYGCSQQDLYSGGRILWDLYQDRWTDFAEYSPVYTETYGVSKLEELDAAERLPDQAAREAIALGLFRQYKATIEDLMYYYGLFKSYVFRIYGDSDKDLKLAAIGDGYYTKATKGSWGDVSALIGQTIPYLEDNLTELMSKNVIPTTFPAKLQTSAKAVKDKYAEYLAAVKSEDNAYNEKISANNAVYDAIAEVNKVAQKIYKKDPESAKLFVWTTIVAQTHGVRNAGVSGKVTDEITKKPISGVLMQIKNGDKSAVTADKTGRFEITPLSSGKYVLIVSKEGYESQEIKFKVTTGVTTRVNVVLKPVATTTS